MATPIDNNQEPERFFDWSSKLQPTLPLWKRWVLGLKHLARAFFNWLEVPVPRWRPVVATLLVVALVGGLLIYNGRLSLAASFTFVQTDWSGGTSASTIVHPTNQTGWNKYSAATNTVTNGAGTITDGTYSSNFTEDFISTTYKDTGNTTGTWDTTNHRLSTVSQYQYYRSITIDHTKVPTTDQTNFPVLVSGTYSYLATTGHSGLVTNANGYDIIFASDSACSSTLAWETELYTATDGTVKYWVKIPTVSHTSDTVFYLCYGNSNITTDQSSATSVWDSNFKGVWHLPNGTTLTANDSTSNANNGTIGSGAAVATGQIDGGAAFDRSSNSSINVGSGSSLNISAQPLTLEAWIKPTSISTSGVGDAVIYRAGTPVTSYSLVILNDSGKSTANLLKLITTTSTVVSNQNVIGAGAWYHVAVVYNSNNVTFYVNGVNAGSSSYSDPLSSATFPVIFGDDATGGPGQYNGILDEVRISSTNRPANWITTEYNNQNSPSTFYTIGSEQTISSSAVGQSIKVNSGSDHIKSVTLTKTDSAGIGVITYYVSNDGGSNFFAVTPSSQYNFAAAGSGDLRWKVTLTNNATVSSISLAYSGFYATSDLTSSAYNTGDPGNIIAKVAWTDANTTSTEIVKVQVRTSSNGSSWSGWCGFSDTGSSCDGSNYFLTANNNISIGSSNPVRSGGNDQWFQYKVTLLSDGLLTPSFNDITVTYVVNVAPEFNSINGVTASQITNSTDTNYNKVQIDYSIRDTDTTTGSTSPGFITPSFEYNIGGGWLGIASNYLSANATDNKAVDSTNYTSHTAYWDAKTQIPTNYLATAQVRVTANDNEAANNTATSTSSNFTLDTKNPVVTFNIDASQDQLSIAATDDSNLEYKLSNNEDMSADGLNNSSGSWQSAGGNSISLTPSWDFAEVPNHPTVYLQVRDSYGNVTSSTAVAPSPSSNMYIKDISDSLNSNFAEFVSWSVYSPASGAVFSKYEIYRSTDGSSYSLADTISLAQINYFADFNLTQGSTYYYKIKTVDTDTDKSTYSPVISDTADGQGGSDNTPPGISNVTVTETQSTFATITWDTDELSDSRVDFSVSPSTAFNAGGQTASSFLTSHSVTLTGLTPDTSYLFRVRSSDAVSNSATDDNDGAGYSFTTSSGPVISNVTESSIGDVTATIFWNTDIDSDSHVTFSISSNLSSSTTVGTTTLVGGSAPFQHSVNLTNLTGGTTYYYYVESKDGSDNNTRDTNGNNYYSFTTTNDNRAPVISGLSTPVISPTAVAIVWQTDELATTQLDYGTSPGVYTTTTDIDSTLSIFHIVSISNLTENTVYYFRARSKDQADNEALSDEDSVTTDRIEVITVVVGGGGGGSSQGVVLDTAAPTISNIKTQAITSFNATITFDTNEDSLGIVHYYPKADPDKDHSSSETGYAKSHSIDLTGLTLGTEYEFEAKAIDKAGNTGASDKQTFTSLFFTQSSINIKDAEAFQKEVDDAIASALPSLVAPFIEKPQVTELTDVSATVTWRTNIKSYSVVGLATEDQYDKSSENPYLVEISDTTNKVTSHSIDLQSLKPNTRYHFVVKSFSLPQVVGASQDLTFVTEALKIQAHIGNITNSSFRATWGTTDPTTSVVEYRNLKTGDTNQKASEEKTTSHDILVDNLTPGTTYEVNVFGVSVKGNKVTTATAIKVTTSVDTTAPQITGLKIDSALIPGRADKTQTIISWKTDEPSTSTVNFKEGTATPTEKLTNKVEITNSLVLDHAIVVSSMKPGGLYSIQVISVDAASNETVFPTRTIVVPRQSESIIDIIFKNFEDTFQFLKNVNK